MAKIPDYLEWNPENLFPLPPEEDESVHYHAAQFHSEKVDHYLGLRVDETEEAIRQSSSAHSHDPNQNTWRGVSTRITMTPYSELHKILSRIFQKNTPETTHLVDLGAGYARLAFILAQHYPQTRFTAYELEGLRIQEAQRCFAVYLEKLNRSCTIPTWIEGDLASPSLQPLAATHYFIYDYGSASAVRKTLEDLRKIAQKQAIQVIARGKLSRHLIEQECPWLSQIIPAQHYSHSSIYSSG